MTTKVRKMQEKRVWKREINSVLINYLVTIVMTESSSQLYYITIYLKRYQKDIMSGSQQRLTITTITQYITYNTM